MLKRSLMLAVLGLALPWCVPVCAQTLDKIRKSGVITLGYIDGAAPFSFADGNGQPQGYSVELCNAVAEGVGAQLKRQGLKVRWVKLTIQDRIDAVRTGKVDLECSTTTWTLSRQQLVDFSLVTFVDGGSLMVKSESGVAGLGDLEGKRIAAITGTTTERALRDALARRKVKAELVAIKTREEGLALLREGQVDALASDRTALIGVVVMSGRAGGQGAANYRLLDHDFSIEQYALMMRRADPDFRLAVNRVLAGIYRSGAIEEVYGRWLGPLGPPSVLLSATYFIQTISE
ncbi:MAG TPA: amino acid ABC transporter substrate-binding protein [Burkholderiales bacterium]|nr:amino acid ABC transporter substrate-binding protein [Burkholderiales bacterium]